MQFHQRLFEIDTKFVQREWPFINESRLSMTNAILVLAGIFAGKVAINLKLNLHSPTPYSLVLIYKQWVQIELFKFLSLKKNGFYTSC